MEGAYLFRVLMEGADLSDAQMVGANLSDAQMDGANLRGAEMKAANLRGAQMKGADLLGAQLEGAELVGAQLEGANLVTARLRRADLFGAQLEGANLRIARFAGADLRRGDFRRSAWFGPNQASPVHFADLRGARGLRQKNLEQWIGNAGTLLPIGVSEEGEPFYVWSCWDISPPDFDALVVRVWGPSLSDGFLCGREPRHKTGTPLAVDAPYPAGHPLAEAD
jgi:hypothetical protein